MKGFGPTLLQVGAERRTSEPSRNAGHRAPRYPIGRLLSGSLISIPTIPNASARTIAPRASGLELRDAPIVTFHVAVRTFCQTRCKPAPFPFRECRFLSIRERRLCCRRNPKRQQNHRYSVKVQYRGPFPAAYWIKPTANVHHHPDQTLHGTNAPG